MFPVLGRQVVWCAYPISSSQELCIMAKSRKHYDDDDEAEEVDEEEAEAEEVEEEEEEPEEEEEELEEEEDEEEEERSRKRKFKVLVFFCYNVVGCPNNCLCESAFMWSNYPNPMS